MKKIILTLILAPCLSMAAASSEATALKQDADFDSLGGNQIILDRAQALAPEKQVSVVQNRTVPLDKRFEIAPEFAGTFGGDSYNQTKTAGMNLHYHFNSRWSIGAKYEYAFNTLTPEGKAMVQNAIDDYNKNPDSPSAAYPQINYPKSQTMALVNWYPFYGKMNLLDKGIAQFDMYFLAGYGQVQLLSGSAPTYMGGAGMAFWVSNNFSTRGELRFQNYKSKLISEEKNMELTIASLQLGWLL